MFDAFRNDDDVPDRPSFRERHPDLGGEQVAALLFLAMVVVGGLLDG